MSCFSFCLSEELFISPSVLNGSLEGESALGWTIFGFFFVFSFQHSEYIIHSLLTYKASVENSAYVLWEFLCT